MNSMIGGTDVIFETARQGFDIRLLLDAVLEVWPDGLFQDAEEEGVRRLSELLADQGAAPSREFFVYKNAATADSWAREGWTEEHASGMAHFLVGDDATQPEKLQLTLVIGSLIAETVRLVAAVFDALAQMTAGGPGPRERCRRVDWETDLRAVGYTLGQEQFSEKVEELRSTLFPDWTADQLACHPHEALQFCEVVRRVIAPVPDHLVMMALRNRWRQAKKGTASFEPRLLWKT